MVVCVVDWIPCFQTYKREYRAHAIKKMVERNIGFNEIDEASGTLQIVKEYADDTPYASCLALAFTKKNRPLHLVFSVNPLAQTVYIITVYEPDSTQWNDTYTRRSE